MIDQQERYYNILKLNRWFALSSIVFVGIFILVFVDDYNRPWKKYQKEFRGLEIEFIKGELDDLNSSLDENSEFTLLEEDLLKAESELESKKDEIVVLNKKIKRVEAEQYRVNQDHQFAKAEWGVAKYTADQAQHGHGDLESALTNLDRLYKLTSNYKLELEGVDAR